MGVLLTCYWIVIVFLCGMVDGGCGGGGDGRGGEAEGREVGEEKNKQRWWCLNFVLIKFCVYFKLV